VNVNAMLRRFSSDEFSYQYQEKGFR
jgi:hypothetical protein